MTNRTYPTAIGSALDRRVRVTVDAWAVVVDTRIDLLEGELSYDESPLVLTAAARDAQATVEMKNGAEAVGAGARQPRWLGVHPVVVMARAAESGPCRGLSGRSAGKEWNRWLG